MSQFGGKCLAVACDLRSRTAIAESVARSVRHFGGLDILINNAAACMPFRLEEASDEEIDVEIETNFTAPIYLMRAAIPHLKARGGDIVNVSSESVRQLFAHLTLYAATKAGLESISVGLREELRAHDIRVSIFRSGRMQGSAIGTNWKPERAEAFVKAATEAGHMAFSGEGATMETSAEAIFRLLTLPRDATVDLMELRSTR